MCSAANVYAHAGENGVAIPKNGTASLDTTVGSRVHLTASGDCAASVRLAAAREGSTAPPYVQVETFNAARGSGFAHVYRRGALANELPRLLADYST